MKIVSSVVVVLLLACACLGWEVCYLRTQVSGLHKQLGDQEKNVLLGGESLKSVEERLAAIEKNQDEDQKFWARMRGCWDPVTAKIALDLLQAAWVSPKPVIEHGVKVGGRGTEQRERVWWNGDRLHIDDYPLQTATLNMVFRVHVPPPGEFDYCLKAYNIAKAALYSAATRDR